MPYIPTLCHGEGNLGRICYLRDTCRRYTELLLDQEPHPTQATMLCQPGFTQEHPNQRTYHYYTP